MPMNRNVKSNRVCEDWTVIFLQSVLFGKQRTIAENLTHYCRKHNSCDFGDDAFGFHSFCRQISFATAFQQMEQSLNQIKRQK
jgi:hypothetical protein